MLTPQKLHFAFKTLPMLALPNLTHLAKLIAQHFRRKPSGAAADHPQTCAPADLRIKKSHSIASPNSDCWCKTSDAAGPQPHAFSPCQFRPNAHPVASEPRIRRSLTSRQHKVAGRQQLQVNVSSFWTDPLCSTWLGASRYQKKNLLTSPVVWRNSSFLLWVSIPEDLTINIFWRISKCSTARILHAWQKWPKRTGLSGFSSAGKKKGGSKYLQIFDGKGQPSASHPCTAKPISSAFHTKRLTRLSLQCSKIFKYINS